MDNRNQALFEALRNVEPVTETSSNVNTEGTFMSVADYRRNNPEGEIDSREIVQGNNDGLEQALERLEKLKDEFEAEENRTMTEEITNIINLLTGKPLINDDEDDSMRYGEARELAHTIINKLVENERLQSIDDLVDGYDTLEEFMNTYMDTIADLFNSYGVVPEDEDNVLSAIIDILADHTLWFEEE